MIPLDNVISVVESCEDIVIRFNGDPYRGVLRSVPSEKVYKKSQIVYMHPYSAIILTQFLAQDM